MKHDVYQVVTDRIVRLLESGTVPWHQPWKGQDQWPQNFLSRKSYRGINSFLLNSAGYSSPFWLTYKQVQSLGGRIRKGEKSFPVVFWKIFREENDPENKRVPFLRYYSVFNVAQCEGISVPDIQAVETVSPFQRIDKCERIVAAMLKPPTIRHEGFRAYYSPPLDEITMPPAKTFESGEAYYSTLFHELTHATGHVSRLNRKEVTDFNRFGSDPYSREELVAEMGSAFLCGHCGIENQTIDQSASYIQSWLERLKDDRKLVVIAAAQAQRACDLILGIKHEEEGTVKYEPKEFKVVALRECPSPESMQLCDQPQIAAEYWRAHIATAVHFNPECESFAVLLLNTRRRIKGHHVIATGTLESVCVQPREVFRSSIIAAASSIVVMHNHPSGEPQPSEADIRVTRDLVRAGQLLKIEVCDHVIVGHERHCSLRELGYFAI